VPVSEVEIRPARLEDAEELAPKLRDADLREIQASVHDKPLALLQKGIKLSEPCFAVVDGLDRVIALFGVVPDTEDEDVGLIWMLASDELVDHQTRFIRESRVWIEELQGRFPVLWNFVDARNDVHIRWLLWCGFSLVQRIESYGVEKRPFLRFERTQNTLC
jgi:hypothetical protein